MLAAGSLPVPGAGPGGVRRQDRLHAEAQRARAAPQRGAAGGAQGSELRAKHPGVSIIYADFFGPVMDMVESPRKLGQCLPARS